MKIKVDSNSLGKLSPQETKQLQSELNILKTKEIPHDSMLEKILKEPKIVLRKISVFRYQGRFYYRIEDYAIDQNERIIGTLARDGYSSDDLKRTDS